jgi:hypothetical protein
VRNGKLSEEGPASSSSRALGRKSLEEPPQEPGPTEGDAGSEELLSAGSNARRDELLSTEGGETVAGRTSDVDDRSKLSVVAKPDARPSGKHWQRSWAAQHRQRKEQDSAQAGAGQGERERLGEGTGAATAGKDEGNRNAQSDGPEEGDGGRRDSGDQRNEGGVQSSSLLEGEEASQRVETPRQTLLLGSTEEDEEGELGTGPQWQFELNDNEVPASQFQHVVRPGRGEASENVNPVATGDASKAGPGQPAGGRGEEERSGGHPAAARMKEQLSALREVRTGSLGSGGGYKGDGGAPVWEERALPSSGDIFSQMRAQQAASLQGRMQLQADLDARRGRHPQPVQDSGGVPGGYLPLEGGGGYMGGM